MMPAKNKFISEIGADVPDRMPEERMHKEEMTIQSQMGFTGIEENVHGKSSEAMLPEHPRKV